MCSSCSPPGCICARNTPRTWSLRFFIRFTLRAEVTTSRHGTQAKRTTPVLLEWNAILICIPCPSILCMVSEPILQRNIDSMPLTTQHSHICWVCNRPMLLRPAPRLCLRLMPLLPVMHSILDASYVIHSSVRDVVAESAFARRQQLRSVTPGTDQAERGCGRVHSVWHLPRTCGPGWH